MWEENKNKTQKQQQRKPTTQDKGRWIEEKCLVAKSILEWLLVNKAERNTFSSPSETHWICKLPVNFFSCSILKKNEEKLTVTNLALSTYIILGVILTFV